MRPTRDPRLPTHLPLPLLLLPLALLLPNTATADASRNYTAHPDMFCSGGGVLFDNTTASTSACADRCTAALCACFCVSPPDPGTGAVRCRMKSGTPTLAASHLHYTAYTPAAAAPANSSLWLDFAPPPTTPALYAHLARIVAPTANLGTSLRAATELQAALGALLNRSFPIVPPSAPNTTDPGSVVLRLTSTPTSTSTNNITTPSTADEGYTISASTSAPTVIASASTQGLLYGAFAFLQRMRRDEPVRPLQLRSTPNAALRMWDLWDNVDGSVERGYAGRSVFDWGQLPTLQPRYQTYARLLASLGINAIVWNNVNACGAGNEKLLTPEYMAKLAPLAALFASYGLRSFLSPCYASPILAGGLKTADPLDPAVQVWWANTTAELVRTVPSFRGFLIKADCEGQPGPASYNRSILEGVAPLAAAVAKAVPADGLVLWRAFAHPPRSQPAASQPSYQFQLYHQYDGQFPPNVVIQVKNGPLDFQPREPVHSLFAKMAHTPTVLEVEATQEYLGQAWHLASLATMWASYMQTDLAGDGSARLADIIGARIFPSHAGATGTAAVSNFGDDPSWTGHPLAALNSFAYGRLAWDASLSPANITAEWVQASIPAARRSAGVRSAVQAMLMSSWEAYENYTSPLGIGFVCAANHYDMDLPHRQVTTNATKTAIGWERAGTFAQTYNTTLAARYASPATTPDELLLFFHNLPYSRRLNSRPYTVLEWIYCSHRSGAATAQAYVRDWQQLAPEFQHSPAEAAFHANVLLRLQKGAADANTFAASVIDYFVNLTGVQAPAGPC